MKWAKQIQYAALVRKGGRLLGLIAASVPGDRTYIAAAFETEGESLSAILADHGHQIIGEDFKTLKAAQAACKAYAKRWLAKQAKIKTCACPEIDAAIVPMKPTDKRRAKSLEAV